MTHAFSLFLSSALRGVLYTHSWGMPLTNPFGQQEKLRLDVDEETAVEWMQQLINESSSALMPALIEQTHRIAQYWR